MEINYGRGNCDLFDAFDLDGYSRSPSGQKELSDGQ